VQGIEAPGLLPTYRGARFAVIRREATLPNHGARYTY
jgi:hypothetical protein